MSDEFNIEIGLQVKQSDIERIQKELNSKIGKVDIGLDISSDWLEKIYNKLNEIKFTPTIDTNKVDDGLNKIKSSFDKNNNLFNLEPEFDPHAFEQIEARLNKVRSSIDSLAKVDISAEGTDKIQRAVLSYVNDVGIAVRETMAWKTAIEDINGEQTEIKNFEIIKVDYSDNIAQINKLSESIENLKSKLITKVDNLKLGNYTDIDISKFDEIKKKISDISDASKESESSLKNLGKELNNLIDKAKLGDIKTDTGLDFKSSKDDIAQYMASLHKLELKQISVKENPPITLETGEQIRKTTVLIEESKNKWREYTTAISSTSNEVRILQGNLKNVNSNLANQEDIIVARLQSKISNFQSEINAKVGNIKLGDIAPQDIASLDKLQAEINSVTTETDDAEQKIRQFKKTFGELADSIKRGKLVDEKMFDIGVSSTNEEYKKYIANLKSVSAEQVKIEQTFIRFGKNQEVLKIVNSLVNEGEGNWRKYQHTFNATTNNVRELDKGFKDASLTVDILGRNIIKFIGSFVSLSTVVSLIRNAFNNMKAIDTQLTELAKVTDLVRTRFQQASLEAVEAGNKWGRTAEDYLKASTTFAQIGAANFKELSDVALLAQSSGSLTAELASDYLIATNAAFKLGNNAEKLTEVLDSQNQVSNRNAINMTEMANATRNYANTAAITGETVQSMTALITTGVSSTKKSGDEVGNALKSITLNIAQIKGEVDGEIIDEASMAKAEKALHGVGIATRTVKDGIVELKTASSVLSELSQKFQNGEINAEKLSVILNDVAGKHRADILAAIVQNFDQYAKAMNDYTNSAGSAAREAQKDIESWEGKLNILSNTWTGFIAKTVDTEWIKGFLDSGTKAIGVLEGIVSLLNTPVGKAGLIAVITGVNKPNALYVQKCA